MLLNFRNVPEGASDPGTVQSSASQSCGKTYEEHCEFLEFAVEQHTQLKKWCEEAGIIYSTSVWDMTSAKEISSLKPQCIKIPAACNTHYEMLEWLCNNYDGEIQLSFGMTRHEEEEGIVRLFEANGRHTLDRTWKGTDHAASLKPDGIHKPVRNLNAVHEALTDKTDEILPIERVQRDKLKYRKHGNGTIIRKK